MKCMYCGADDTKVIDSRLVGDGDQVRRRRQCLDCSERFTTYENAELSLPRIVKRDGSRVNFDEQKLRAGLLRSLEKRPVASEEVEAVVSRLKHRLQVMGEREVPARQIGEWIMQELRELDQVAYVRFASVYRSFQDVNAFKEEIDRLENPIS
jgi:transcriptional repressor NrdR